MKIKNISNNPDLLYIAMINIDDDTDGVKKKVFMQCDALSEYYISISIACYKKNEPGIYNFNTKEFMPFKRLSKLIPRRLVYLRGLRKHLLKTNYGTSYIRYSYFDLSFYRVITLLSKKKTRLFLEIPSFPIKYPEIRLKTLIRYPIFLQDFLFRKKAIRKFDKILSIGAPQKKIYGDTTINIPNGIDRKPVDYHNNSYNFKDLRILCLANMYYHQGYDRLIEGLSNYYNENEDSIVQVFIDFVGDGPLLQHYVNLTKKRNLEKFIVFHGKQTNEKINKITSNVNLACGPLGLHRLGFDYASPLKTKEYMLKGIPFIYSYVEISLDENFPYVLKLPADESPISISKVISFYQNIQKDYPLYSDILHKYAIEKFSWVNILSVLK